MILPAIKEKGKFSKNNPIFCNMRIFFFSKTLFSNMEFVSRKSASSNRSGHVVRNEPEPKYESIKRGYHRYEDINSAYYLDVVSDLQNR